MAIEYAGAYDTSAIPVDVAREIEFMRYNLVGYKLARLKRLCLPNLDSVTGFTDSAMIDRR